MYCSKSQRIAAWVPYGTKVSAALDAVFRKEIVYVKTTFLSCHILFLSVKRIFLEEIMPSESGLSTMALFLFCVFFVRKGDRETSFLQQK
jgi:hypothetical protein